MSVHEETHSPKRSPASAPHKRRRWLPRWPWWLGLALLFGGFALWSLDEVPPNVSDLPFDPLVLRDDENGYILLKRAAVTAAKSLPAGAATGTDSRNSLYEMVSENTWDEQLATTWLTALEPVWPLYKKASEATATQAQQLADQAAEQNEVQMISQLSQYAALRAKNDLRNNRPEDAAEITISTLRIFSLLAKSRTDLNRYLVASEAKKMALVSFAQIARHPQTPIPLLRKILIELEAARDEATGLPYAIRSDIHSIQTAQATFAKSGMREINKGAFRMDKFWDNLRIPGLYKPNKTLRIYTQALRAALAVNVENQAAIDALAYTGTLRKIYPTGYANLNPDNLQGRALLRLVSPYWPSLLRGHLEDQSRNSVHQALVALHIYKREHGEFPASLDALVPDYLSAVPKDYFDGAPVRYSQLLGVVWSVGRQSLTITSEDQYTDDDVAAWLMPQKPSHWSADVAAP